VHETMELFNWNREVEKYMHFLDCYSWKSGKSKSKYSASLTSLTDVSVGITSIIDDAGVQPDDGSRIVIDSFTDIINYGGGRGRSGSSTPSTPSCRRGESPASSFSRRECMMRRR
jgi:hypothetical protein